MDNKKVIVIVIGFLIVSGASGNQINAETPVQTEVNLLEKKIDTLSNSTQKSEEQRATYRIKYSFFNIGLTKISAESGVSGDNRIFLVRSSTSITEGDKFNSEELCIYDTGGLLCYKGYIESKGEKTLMFAERVKEILKIYILDNREIHTQEFPFKSFDLTTADLHNKRVADILNRSGSFNILDLGNLAIYRGSVTKSSHKIKCRNRKHICRKYSVTYNKNRVVVSFPEEKGIVVPFRIEEEDQDGKINSSIIRFKTGK